VPCFWLSEIPVNQADIVPYTTKDGAAHEFDALEVLAQLSCHVPKTYENTTRYYGRYSSRRRGERAKLSPPPAGEPESDYRREFLRSGWAACIKRIYEIDPLECPTCKAQMPIIAPSLWHPSLWYTLLYRSRPSAAAYLRNSFSYPAISTTSPAIEK
jgi:hypothetical protein